MELSLDVFNVGDISPTFVFDLCLYFIFLGEMIPSCFITLRNFGYIIEFPQNLLFTISANQTLKLPTEYAKFLEDVSYETYELVNLSIKLEPKNFKKH